MFGLFNKKKPKKLWQKIVGAAFSVITVVVLAYIAISLITGRTVSFSWLTGIFTSQNRVVITDELLFDVGRDRVFANLGDSIAAAGSLGVQVLRHDGTQSLRDTFRMFRPAIVSNGPRAIAFDIGGTSVRVFDSGQLLAAFYTEGTIISASINRNGWFTVNTQEGGGLRSVVTVYNAQGNAVFAVFLGSGYAFSSVLSPDNRSLAVLNLTDAGSRITLYQGLDDSQVDAQFTLQDGLILAIRFAPNGNLIAVGADVLISIDRNGIGSIIYEYSDNLLGGFIPEDNFIILHLLDFNVGHSGRLVRIDYRGRILSEKAISREIISMSYNNGNLVVLFSDSVEFFDSNLNPIPVSDPHGSIIGINNVLALGGGVALAAGEHIAEAIKTE